MSFKPNRDLLNVNFQGYKLSDKNLDVVISTKLPAAVAVEKLQEGDFSYQHMRAHAFHNHLHFDPADSSSVYWCAEDGSVRKAVLGDGGNVSFQTVLQLPAKSDDQATNPTLQFFNNTLGVVCAGDNKLVIFQRDTQNETTEEWTVLKSFEVSDGKPVALFTTRAGDESADILCAELNLHAQDPSSAGEAVPKTALSSAKGLDRLVATYKWIRVKLKNSTVEDYEVLGSFQSNSLALYSTFQYHPASGQQQLLLISESKPLIDDAMPLPDPAESAKQDNNGSENNGTRDTEFSGPEQHAGLGFKKHDYDWTQSDSDLTITVKLAEDVKKGDIDCVFSADELMVGLSDGTTFLQGELAHSVDPQASTWTIENHTLEVSLEKKAAGVTWKSVLKAAQGGGEEASLPLREGLEDTLSPEELEKARKLLTELQDKGELEPNPAKKACPAIQSMLEECDASEEDAVLHVISEQCKLIQRVGLGGRQIVFTAPSPNQHPHYFSLRHDVDAVVWQPCSSLTPPSSPRWSHLATFNALGYVQASKRERRFTTCSPGLKYAVISDSTKHVFVYVQPGQARPDCAVEYVFSIPERTDILGLVATDEGVIYVLTNKELVALKIPN